MGADKDIVEATGGPAYITTTGATVFAYHGLQHVVPYPHVFTVRVKPQWRGQGLREVLVREFPSYPPEHYDLLFRAGLVSVGGEVATPDYRVCHQDRISTTITRHELPVRCLDAIRVLERTPDLFVVDKPHSIPAHPSGRFRINSLLTMVEAQLGERLFCVNRLDRLTSGLVLLARSSSAAGRYSGLLKAGSVRKVYYARVRGRFPAKGEAHYPIYCSDRGKGVYACCQEADTLAASLSLSSLSSSSSSSSSSSLSSLSSSSLSLSSLSLSSSVLPSQSSTSSTITSKSMIAAAGNLSILATTPTTPGTPATPAQTTLTITTATQVNLVPQPPTTPTVIEATTPTAPTLTSTPTTSTKPTTPITLATQTNTFAPWRADAKEAHTRFECVSYDGHTSLVLCRPITGRTHQIRLHLQALGHPIENDASYGGSMYKSSAAQHLVPPHLLEPLACSPEECSECRATPPLQDPAWYPTAIWLHAHRYELLDEQGEQRCHETSLPVWAKPGFDSKVACEGFLSDADPKFNY